MKRRLALVLLISLWGGPATFGAGGTWSGRISDSYCSYDHKKGPPSGSQLMNEIECVALCVASGTKYVFVTDTAVYPIANQGFKGLRFNIGHPVQLDGELEGTTITVSKITPIHKKKAKE